MTEVWRRLEVVVEVSMQGAGKALAADVLRDVERALGAGCEYAPQEMWLGPIRSVRFSPAAPVFKDYAFDEDRDAREDDLAELARLKAMYEE